MIPCLSFTYLCMYLTVTLISFHVSSAEPPQISPDEVLYSNTLLASEPVINISPKGIVTISLTTSERCKGGKAFIGIFPDAASLKYPIYRKKGKFHIENQFSVTVSYDLGRLEAEKIDINNLRENRRGHIAYRIILLSDELQVFDRIFAYLKTADSEYRRAPALIEGPFVDCVTDSSAILSWQFDHPVACKLNVEPKGFTYSSQTVKERYEIEIAELTASTLYNYTISWDFNSTVFSTSDFTFRTAPPKGSDRPFSFGVLSDGRATIGSSESSVEGVNREVVKSLLTSCLADSVSLIVFPGDLVSGYISNPEELKNQFRSFKRITAPIGSRVPIFEGMGNHDLALHFFAGDPYVNYIPRTGDESAEAIFAEQFVNPINGPEPSTPYFATYKENVYSFDWGNAHFTMLNSNYMQKGEGEAVKDKNGELQGVLRDEQLRWLENDLEKARLLDLKHLFVFVHEPAFPNGGHVKDAMWWNGKKPEIIRMRDRFWKILCENEVLAAFFGDDHNYSRALIDTTVNSNFDVPIWQIITGGAGAPFYAQEKSTPWIHTVKKFFPLPHFCLIEVAGDRVFLTVKSKDGAIVDRCELTGI